MIRVQVRILCHYLFGNFSRNVCQKISSLSLRTHFGQSKPLYYNIYIMKSFFISYRICCLCAPTLYKNLRELKKGDCEVYLLEYDKRFAVFGRDFVFYDYNEPLNLPKHISKNSFDVIFADPPFLTEECFCKVAKTVEYLMKDKLIICTAIVFLMM